MQQDHRKDFYEVLKKIKELDSFALSRCADGEATILRNMTIGNKDGWLYKKDKNLIFRADLRKSLMCQDENFVYGISSRNVDEKNYLFLRKLIQQDLSYVTFSDIWVNANYDLFNRLFFPALNDTKKDVIIITNPKAKINNLKQFIDIKDFISIKGNCVSSWEAKREYLKALFDLKVSLTENAIFLFAAGPLSNIIIYEMWRINRNNIYLDMGSTLDPIIFNRQSRNYHNQDHPHRTFVNKW